MVLTAVATVLAFGCSSTASPPEPAEEQGAGPRVLFQVQGKHALVALSDLDGSNVAYPLRRLPGGDQTNPDWSPDGTRIVVAVNDGSRDDLWIADADGTGARKLLDCARRCRWLDDPDWSPDGSSIVFSRTVAANGAGLGSLEVVDVESGDVSVVLPRRSRSFTAGARWSPDGSRIVFERVHKVGRGLDADIDAVTLRITKVGSGRAGAPLTEPDLFAATADWSPDGRSIVYSALAGPGSEAPDLFVLPAAGGEPRRVTTLADRGGYAAEPTWRSDSMRIVFSGRLPGAFRDEVLLTVPANGVTEPARLGNVPLIGRHPRVEPGG